jgi:hypothetical protein
VTILGQLRPIALIFRASGVVETHGAREGMAGNIFINYRRGDDPGFAQALFGRLEQAFPSERLFMDIDNIAPGLDFVQVLNDEVARCDVLIAGSAYTFYIAWFFS